MNRSQRHFNADIITLAHGSGGKAMRDLIDHVFVKSFDNDYLKPLEDQARFDLAAIEQQGDRLALTTDSYVVDPLFFPGGDIGKLAVTGTVNDLAVGGARPLYLTCGMIIEEGLAVEDLRRIVMSMQSAAREAGVAIVTGDTKVVQRGACDKLFINTAGVGVIPQGVEIRADKAKPGDVIIVNGYIGDHGAAIVDARGEMALENTIQSDCQTLNGLIEMMLTVCPDIHCMRDATRGGLATVLNEFAEASEVSVILDETAIPVRQEVRGMCEILGLDPLYLANEGKLVAVVPASYTETLIAQMKQHPAGRESVIIGRVEGSPAGRVILETGFGGNRIIDMLVGEQLPRIC
ncbi:hydrogenase expression/formation protein HypE [methane-oxidizing endosymbiont of Gigantopelta aegis]|uniref:hydrogenase expression/formation protein HypE n=1 Tax=methane-oxidizing endosymbiont of Gigantopelta aegis TaxID=2794938 RepID=UPI0018DB52A6|nr:hydrogenase expression/formation protein HypE [methane-oxidizing endosymbiont of Gigantopelta aegis]